MGRVKAKMMEDLENQQRDEYVNNSEKYIDNIISERNIRFKDLTNKINNYSKKNKDTLKILHLNNQKYKEDLNGKLSEAKTSFSMMIVLLLLLGSLFSFNLYKNPSVVGFIYLLFVLLFLIFLVYNSYSSVKKINSEISNSDVDLDILEEFEKTFKNNEIYNMETGFKRLENNFKSEETNWQKILLFIFSIIIIIPFSLAFKLFEDNVYYPKILTSSGDLKLYILFNLGLFVALYFSAKQYNKAKNLRIDNQNKIAVIDGFYGLKKEKIEQSQYISNFLDVVFTRPKFYNEKSLPIEEFTKLAEIFSKINKNK